MFVKNWKMRNTQMRRTEEHKRRGKEASLTKEKNGAEISIIGRLDEPL